MEERSEGLILRTRPLTDTSLVVEWLTPDLGRISTVAKGARRPKSPFAGKLDLFYEAQFSFVRSRRSELHTLREVVVRNTHVGIRADLALLHQVAYFTVLIEQGTERETPLPEVHELIRQYLHALPTRATIPEAMFLFEHAFLMILGMAPDMAHDVFRATFATLQPIPRTERIELNRKLRFAIANALGRIPPQRQAAIDALKN